MAAKLRCRPCFVCKCTSFAVFSLRFFKSYREIDTVLSDNTVILSKLKSCRRAPPLPLCSQDGARLGRVGHRHIYICLWRRVHRFTLHYFTVCSATSGYFQCPEFCWFCQCERPVLKVSVCSVQVRGDRKS